jgi:hypothetical protein
MIAGLKTRLAIAVQIRSEAWPRPNRPGGEVHVQGRKAQKLAPVSLQVFSPRLPV